MNFLSKKLTQFAANIPGSASGVGNVGGGGSGGVVATAGATSSGSNSNSPAPARSEATSRLPAPPPLQPDLSNLTPDELDQLKKVLKKQEQFETEIERSVSGLKRTMDYLISIQNRQEALQQQRSPELPARPDRPEQQFFGGSLRRPDSRDLSSPNYASLRSPRSPRSPNEATSPKPQPQPQPPPAPPPQQPQPPLQPPPVTKVETPSSLASSLTFMSRFTSLKSLLDDNGEPTQSSSGFFSKFSSTSASSSTTSLAKQTVCFICKKPLAAPSSPAPSTPQSAGAVGPGGPESVPNKFRRWRKEVLVYNYSSSTEKPAAARGNEQAQQCADCGNLVCERCGNTTSPDFGSRDASSVLSPNKDRGKWRCKICIVKREVAKKSGLWSPEPGASVLRPSAAVADPASNAARSLKSMINQVRVRTPEGEEQSRGRQNRGHETSEGAVSPSFPRSPGTPPTRTSPYSSLAAPPSPKPGRESPRTPPKSSELTAPGSPCRSPKSPVYLIRRPSITEIKGKSSSFHETTTKSPEEPQYEQPRSPKPPVLAKRPPLGARGRHSFDEYSREKEPSLDPTRELDDHELNSIIEKNRARSARLRMKALFLVASAASKFSTLTREPIEEVEEPPHAATAAPPLVASSSSRSPQSLYLSASGGVELKKSPSPPSSSVPPPLRLTPSHSPQSTSPQTRSPQTKSPQTRSPKNAATPEPHPPQPPSLLPLQPQLSKLPMPAGVAYAGSREESPITEVIMYGQPRPVVRSQRSEERTRAFRYQIDTDLHSSVETNYYFEPISQQGDSPLGFKPEPAKKTPTAAAAAGTLDEWRQRRLRTRDHQFSSTDTNAEPPETTNKLRRALTQSCAKRTPSESVGFQPVASGAVSVAATAVGATITSLAPAEFKQPNKAALKSFYETVEKLMLAKKATEARRQEGFRDKRAKSLFCRNNSLMVPQPVHASGPPDPPRPPMNAGRKLSATALGGAVVKRAEPPGPGQRFRSRSNEIELPNLNESRLNHLIEQQSTDADADENLTALAKVLLIEHKRSLQMTQTVTEESSISFQASTDSRRDSFSSRQDSSISVTESEVIRQAAFKGLNPSAAAATGENRRASLRNSEQWHKRRRDLMKKSKKWSQAVDENAAAGGGGAGTGDTLNLDRTEDFDSPPNLTESQLNDDSSLASNYDLNRLNSVTTQDSVNSNNSPTDHIGVTPSYVRTSQINLSSKGVYAAVPEEEAEQRHPSPSSISVNILTSSSSFHQIGIKPRVNSTEQPPPLQHASGGPEPVNATSPHRKTVRRLPEVPKSPAPRAKEPGGDDHEADKHSSSSGSQKYKMKAAASLDGYGASASEGKVKLGDTKNGGSSTKSSSNNFSRSIDSSDSLKRKEGRLNFAKSVDLDRTDKNNSNLIIGTAIFSPQRSLDYPYIVRRTPNLSDIVRKRLLFQKVSKGATLLNESFSSSMEKKHVPKAPRKIIIRQDNSIEISLSRPPKLRRQTISEDFGGSNFTQLTESVTESPVIQGLIVKNPSMLSVSSTGNDRRKTIETCENIFLQSEESTKLRARTPPSNPHRILLYKDKTDKSVRTCGLGMRIIGGHECEDGSLGCFVTLTIKGGPADMNNIEVGDQILEFNGHSLIDSTYEEVRTLQNNTGDYVQLVVQHNNIRLKLGVNSSPLEVSRHFETVPRLCQSLNRKRRNLPPLPSTVANQETQQSQGNSGKKDSEYVVAEVLQVPAVASTLLKPILINRGRLLMQIWDNSKLSKVAITINQANNLPSRCESEQWFTFVVGRLIFEESSVQTFQTKPMLTSNPIWNETFLFNYSEPIEDVNLEICVHDTQTPTDTRLLRENFIGMIILPLCEANLEDEPRWYELRDKPTRKTSTASVTFKSSSNDSQDSLCDKKKKPSKHVSRKSAMSLRKSSLHGSNPNNLNSSSSLSNVSKITPVRKISQAFARLLSFRRNSESAVKRNLIRFESEESEEPPPSADQLSSALKSPRNNQRRHTELLNVNFLLPPTSISSNPGSRNASVTSVVDVDEDIDSYFSAEQQNQLNDPTPGKGQVTPKDCKEEIVAGDIKLGFVMSKGQLEITVFEARNLNRLDGLFKDTYVKTYLRTGTHRLHKKKTQVVRNSCEPVYNTKLHYNACNVLGRRIQVVMIWQKAPKLDKNQCIGEAFIQLDHLDLSQQTIGWYKLYKQHAVDSDFYDSA